MLTDVVTSDFLTWVFNEVLTIVPVLLPVTVAWVGIVKGVGFLKSTLYSA